MMPKGHHAFWYLVMTKSHRVVGLAAGIREAFDRVQGFYPPTVISRSFLGAYIVERMPDARNS